MKDKFIIINKTAIQKRIEELETKIIPNPNLNSEIDSYNLLFLAKQNELNKILSQSIPLIPEIEKAFDAGSENPRIGGSYPMFEMEKEQNNAKQFYILNLKLDI